MEMYSPFVVPLIHAARVRVAPGAARPSDL